MSTALGDVGSEQARASIARQMRRLLASDELYAAVARPEINGVLAANGIDGSDVPKSVFLPDETKWLDEGEVSAALDSVTGSSTSETPGVHGLGLIGTSVNGTELSAESATGVVSEGTPEVEVTVQNQGESTENGISVSVTVNGETLQSTIDSIAAGEEGTASIPLTGAPSGEVTLEVAVDTVPGEQVSENNEASYTVAFE
jgi:subtilase family serine protease